MKKLFTIFFFIPLLSISQLSEKGLTKLDSLKESIKTANHDSTIINSYIEWYNLIEVKLPKDRNKILEKIDNLVSNSYENVKDLNIKFYRKAKAFTLNEYGRIDQQKANYESAIHNYRKALDLHKLNKDKRNIASSYNNIAIILYYQGKLDSVITYFKKAAFVSEQMNDKVLLGKALNNLGAIYRVQGDISNAIEILVKSLKVREELEDSLGLISTYGNLGLLYKGQKNYSKALNLQKEALLIGLNLKDSTNISASLNNIGTTYQALGELDSAIDFYKKSLAIDFRTEDKLGIANAFSNIGQIFYEQLIYDSALVYYRKSLNMFITIQNREGEARLLHNLGDLSRTLGQNKKALDYDYKSLKLTSGLNNIKLTRDIYLSLWLTHKSLSNHKIALEMLEKYITLRDSIENEENTKEVIRQEFKYKYEKQVISDSIKTAEAKKVVDAQMAKQEAQLEHERTQRYALLGGISLLTIFGGIMFNRFRITRRQKRIIEKQKHIVDQQKAEVEEAHEQLSEKNKEITDSIIYAKRIQEAILPPLKLVKAKLSNSFIYYQPKDIVAGDFYWMEHKKNVEGQELVFFAAADCTGHGVPGAMVSVVCSNALNKSVNEFDLIHPGEILDKTRELVIQRFEKSEEEVNDGMDIALCAFNTFTKELNYSGAHNPLWIIRKGEGEIEEIKADKQPIGKHFEIKAFSNHTIQLNQGDSIYIFSDGYVDQFGGEKGKKLKSPNFKRFLLTIQNLNMDEQLDSIKTHFNDWKGEEEQVDDVCVIGLRV